MGEWISSYEEDDDLCEWPYWERSVWIHDFETETDYYKSRLSEPEECHNIMPMNGKKGSWSRYYRVFEGGLLGADRSVVMRMLDTLASNSLRSNLEPCAQLSIWMMTF